MQVKVNIGRDECLSLVAFCLSLVNATFLKKTGHWVRKIAGDM